MDKGIAVVEDEKQYMDLVGLQIANSFDRGNECKLCEKKPRRPFYWPSDSLVFPA